MITETGFFNLSTPEVAELVREAGPQVCVLAVNGTRRWFLMEHHDNGQNPEQAYLNAAGKRFIELCRLCFDHGLDTLLSPIFSSSHFERKSDYVQKIGVEGLAFVAKHPAYLDFFREYQVRVRFYGDYRKQLAGPKYSYLCDLFDDLTRATASNDRFRLFFGVFANDATESIAELAVRHHQATGEVPSREKLVELYYGEPLNPASLFIGFSKLRVYDYPLLNLGRENLYFTVAPSLYMNQRQLRRILYDHICARPIERDDYAGMSEPNFQHMQNFYRTNRETTLGIGTQLDGIWFPNTQILSQAPGSTKGASLKKRIANTGPSDALGFPEQV